MKLLAIAGAAALGVVLGISMPMQAQDAAPHEEKRAQDQDKKEQQGDKHAHEDAKHEDKRQDNGENREERTARQQDRHEDRADRHEDQGENRRGHIPDDRFRANFGREHTFRIGRPVIVEGQPRFQYGGYWFIIAEPWPVGWGYDDDVFVDYVDDGYYILSPVHPGVRIAINVVF